MNIKSIMLDNEDLEDIGLALKMKEADPEKIVSRDEIMKKLKY